MSIISLEDYMNIHGSVIIGSYIPREIGEIMLKLSNGKWRLVETRFMIMREATREEYLAQDRTFKSSKWKYYYEVRTD